MFTFHYNREVELNQLAKKYIRKMHFLQVRVQQAKQPTKTKDFLFLHA